MKLIWLVLPLVLGITACSKVDDGSRKSTGAEQSSDAQGASAPGVDTAVAPGVAFDFRYGFSLPERRIATVQEGHAALCGRLGVAHCRVTGLSFRKIRDGDIAASTQFRLDPALALAFARDATALVERAEGKLETSQLEGDDAGKAIVAGDKSADAIRAELTKIEAQLRIPGLSKEARGKLVAQSGELRGQLRDLGTARDTSVERIATTPVEFDYEATVTGLALGDPLKQGVGASATSISALLSFLALALGVAGPWALLGGTVFWAIRKWRRKPVVVPIAD